MAMGMSYNEYWEASPYLVRYYKEAFQIKRKLENEMAWIQGIYIYDAVAVCLQNVFRDRGQKREHYMESPLDIFPLTDKEKKAREREEMIKMNKQFEQIRAAQARKKTENKNK